MGLIGAISRLGAALAFVAATAPAAVAYDVQEIGSFHIGGSAVKVEGMTTRRIPIAPGSPALEVDPNGEFHTGQMYVQFVLLKEPKARYPLLMWHTGSATGASFETKPDGRPGWMQFFLRRGHNVYVSDAVERGRSTFQRWPEVYKSEPIFRTKKEAWEIFRIGVAGSWSSDPAKRLMNPGQLFPVAAFEQLQMQIAPRWATNDAATQAAYDALVERVCPCVILAHGQAGYFAMKAALANPQKVKAIVAVEPAHAPKPDADLAKIATLPQLFVWGDFIQTSPIWIQHVAEIRAWHEALRQREAPADWLDLPATGIKGNTHMLMMDQNSDQVAAHINAWLARHKLTKPDTAAAAAGQTGKAARQSRRVRKADQGD